MEQEPIKEALGRTDESKMLGYLPPFSHLTAETVAVKSVVVRIWNRGNAIFIDLQIPCSFCNGMRFKDDVLKVSWMAYLFEILNLYVLMLKVLCRSTQNAQEASCRWWTRLSCLGQLNSFLAESRRDLRRLSIWDRFPEANYRVCTDRRTNYWTAHAGCLSFDKNPQRIVEAGHSVILIEHNAQV